jgi:hypothetical protein
MYDQTMGKNARRSPLTATPVRVPGQSLDEEIQRVRSDAIYDFFFIPLALAMVFLFSLMQWLLKTPPAMVAVLSGIAFAISLLYAIPRMRQARERLRRLRQGQAGERAVAEYLDTLREDGTRVLHDLVGDGFNLDHVLISRHGIFTIETKTISKPTNTDQKISFDGERILIGKYEPPSNPIIQAKAQATWMKRLLRDAIAKDYDVRPVVVFPGWYVENAKANWKTGVWVLEPKALQAFIEREPVRLSDTEIATVTHFLKRHSRGT